MKSNNPGTFVLHFSIIYLTSLLLQPIFESHLNRIKDVDIPYHYRYALYMTLIRFKCGITVALGKRSVKEMM